MCLNDSYFLLFVISYLNAEPEHLLNPKKKNPKQLIIMDQGVGEVIGRFYSTSQSTSKLKAHIQNLALISD